MIVISRSILVFIVFLVAFSTSISQTKFHLVKFPVSATFTVQDAALLGVELDHGAIITDSYIQAIANDVILDSLHLLGIPVSIVTNDLATYYETRLRNEKNDYTLYSTNESKQMYGSMGGFFTLNEIYSIFSKYELLFPDYIRKDTIGITFEGRPIYAYHIGKDTVKDSKYLPRTLITSVHHAREAITPTITCYFVQDFFEKIANNDPFALYVLNNSPITIVPCLNPDGYEYNYKTYPNGGGMWRKNRKINTTSNVGIGVDNNRNYGPIEFWDSPNLGSSINGFSDTFRGDSAFSESENKAMKLLLVSYDIKTAINFHSFSDLIVTPIGALNSKPFDSTEYHYFCADQSNVNKYPFGRDVHMVRYFTRGGSDDYFYAGTQKKVLSITPEVGNSEDGFWPLRSRIPHLVQMSIPSIYSAIRSTNSIPTLYSYSQIDKINLTDRFLLQFSNPSISTTKRCKIRYYLFGNKQSLNIFPILDSLLPIEPTEVKTIQFLISNTSRPPLFEDIIGISIEQQYEDFSFYDTLYYNRSYPNVLPLYNGEDAQGSYLLEGWETEFDLKTGQYSLADNPNNFSNPSSRAFLETSIPINLEDYSDAFIEFDSRWELIGLDDVIVVYFRESESNTKSLLFSNRMKVESKKSGSQLLYGEAGLYGIFQERIVQKASLNKFLGKKGYIGFEVMKKGNSTSKGFNLFSANIVSYFINEPYSRESINQWLTIAESNKSITFTISREYKPRNPNISIKIYSLTGQEVIQTNFEWYFQKVGSFSITSDLLPNGMYTAVVTIDGVTSSNVFTVIQ